MNILIGILSKISNSNLNLYIVHLGANQCSCDPYVDGESFKIEKLVLSVRVSGLVSVMCRSWYCVAWVMSRGVTVVSRVCFRDALLMSRGSRDDVLVTSRCCFGGVMVMSRSRFRSALLMFR